MSERFTSLHFNSAFCQNQQFATHTFRKTFKELENRIRLFILIYERERVKKAAA